MISVANSTKIDMMLKGVISVISVIMIKSEGGPIRYYPATGNKDLPSGKS